MTKDEFWIVHDGRVVCAVSAKTLLLFRCPEPDLLGQNIFGLIPIPEMRALAKLRMEHITTKGDLRAQELPFQRPDRSVFWARVQTHRLGLDTFISTLEYIGDHSPHYTGT